MGRQVLNMGPHGNPGEIAGPVEILMDQGHRTHPIAAFGKQLRDGRIGDPGRLKAEQAVDQLQVVLHAMVDLLEKGVLLLQRGLQPRLNLLEGGDIHRRSQEFDLLPLRSSSYG